jgi:plasmid stabilization system protein ParE
MANTLSIAPRAETDLMEAFKWYEARSVGLGHEFLRCTEARLNLIARMPQLFRRRGPLHRLARIDRFPYAIYFIWEEHEAHVAVRRILNFKQNDHEALSKS